MNINKKDTLLGWIAAISVAVIWGVTGVVSKPLSMAIDPLTLVFFRYVTAVIGLTIIFYFTSKNKSLSEDLGSDLKIEKKDYIKIALCGIIGQGAFSLFNFLSLSHIGATENGVIQGMQPFATVFFGMMFMNFKMNKIQWGAFIASALCIYAMSIGPTNDIENGTPLLGYIFVTCSMLSLAWTAHLRASLAAKYGSVVSMLYQYISVAILGLIVSLTMGLDLSQITIIFSDPTLLALLIFLGMGISGGSYLIQLYSFKRIGVEKATMALNLMPLVGYVVAILTLGEEMHLSKTIIVSLIVVALYVFTKYETRETEKQKSSATKLTTQKA
ncbi:DMT family transporter [Photobacterium damselae]|uniref:DMT family transporter n=1 Tax=Photobacterium damselae TaxID=38293 RepID=UPI000D07174A|nr:DMT family transporter [Photobacterium damselae]EHA1080651.1 DMT family transporter [Photobacterium damselae]MDC4169877.1 DMT family transporter [Photobacterium damselae]NVH46790.1 DMT family transporter [Photobacterium damselae subsp. damselae]NVO72474.1 DMT family transporter [Photobacterium damselae subsp. damselae]PSB79825.1 EamA family transporter [Photobacterium damselae subsp. damselae]